MRLTLRTLLAYMDGLLDPKDHDDFAARVESSEHASDLIHRTRDTTRRLRLAAPPVEDDPSGFDANAVAEYLDSTAGSQAVVDFERLCLESDSHLAEVASCHHILTMVLGEPPAIDAEARRRMYAIPELADALARQATATATPAAGPRGVQAPVGPAERPIDEVPDYLRASGGSALVRWLPAIAALLVLSVVTYLALGPDGFLRNGGPAVAQGGGDGEAEGDASDQGGADTREADTRGDEAAPERDAETLSQEPVASETRVASEDKEAEPGGSGNAARVEGMESAGRETTAPGLPTSGLPAAGLTAPAQQPDGATGVADGAGAGLMPDAQGSPTPSAATAAPAGSPAPTGSTSSTGSTPSTGSTADASPGGIAASEPTAAATQPTPEEGGLTQPQPEPEPRPIGAFVSDAQVLLRWNEADSSWRRLPGNSQVSTGDRLLSLPTFRSQVDFNSDAGNRGLSMQLANGTLIDVERTGPGEPLAVTLQYGQAEFTNENGDPIVVRLTVGGVTGEATIEGLATLSVRAARPFVPGADPIETLAEVQGVFAAPRGGVAWASVAGNVGLQRPGQWRTVGANVGLAEPIDSPPGDPVGGRRRADWKSLAQDSLQRRLNADESVWTQLSAVLQSGRREEVSLAAICSAYVDHPNDAVAPLLDAEQPNAWPDTIRTLRTAMSHSAEQASSIKQALIERVGQANGPKAYRLLCGFSAAEIGETPEEQKTGALSGILDSLSNPTLTVRVIANYNLEQITGQDRVFAPDDDEVERNKTINKLRARLESGRLLRETGK
ncbi:MAG: hypothetical protein AAF790_08760 [Planctomycetota bacterium]